jgi:hypothetical protein
MVTIKVQIGSIPGTCPLCGSLAFLAAHKHPKSMDVLDCKGCSAKFTYSFLLQQITDKTIEHSREQLEASRKGRSPNKPQ